MKNILRHIVLSMMNYKSLTSENPEMIGSANDDDRMKLPFNVCC